MSTSQLFPTWIGKTITRVTVCVLMDPHVWYHRLIKCLPYCAEQGKIIIILYDSKRPSKREAFCMLYHYPYQNIVCNMHAFQNLQISPLCIFDSQSCQMYMFHTLLEIITQSIFTYTLLINSHDILIAWGRYAMHLNPTIFSYHRILTHFLGYKMYLMVLNCSNALYSSF